MNPSKVLLITLVGPHGEVDVAVRADLPAAELLPAFKELVGVQTSPGERDDPSSAKARAGVRQRSGPPAGYGGRAPSPSPPAAESPTWFAGAPSWHGPVSGAPAGGAERAGAAGTAATGHAAQGRGGGPDQGRERDAVPLGGTLADAGIVDGTVLYLYQPASGHGEAAR